VGVARKSLLKELEESARQAAREEEEAARQAKLQEEEATRQAKLQEEEAEAQKMKERRQREWESLPKEARALATYEELRKLIPAKLGLADQLLQLMDNLYTHPELREFVVPFLEKDFTDILRTWRKKHRSGDLKAGPVKALDWISKSSI